jgi:hypothetical protein
VEYRDIVLHQTAAAFFRATKAVLAVSLPSDEVKAMTNCCSPKWCDKALK